MAANQVVNYLENGNIVNSVNYPNICLGPRTGNRVVVLFENNEDTLASVLKTVKVFTKGDPVYGSKGANSALIADVSTKVEGLEKLKGVRRVINL